MPNANEMVGLIQQFDQWRKAEAAACLKAIEEKFGVCFRPRITLDGREIVSQLVVEVQPDFLRQTGENFQDLWSEFLKTKSG